MNKIINTVFAISLLVISGQAAAIAIQGTINIGGGAQVINDGTNATGLDFNCGATCGGMVNNFPPPSGHFTGLGGLSTSSGAGNDLTLYNFLFSGVPQTIWDIHANGLKYSFELSSVSVVSGDTASNNWATLVLSGTGIFNITNADGSYAGYDATLGTWVYSQSGASFSSQSTAVAEPSTIALLGLGLVGLGLTRRLKRAA